MGATISRKSKTAECGDGVVECLAAYIAKTQPGLRGFTQTNLFRMKQYYETYQGDESRTTVATIVVVRSPLPSRQLQPGTSAPRSAIRSRPGERDAEARARHFADEDGSNRSRRQDLGVPPEAATKIPSIKNQKQKLVDRIAALKKQGIASQAATSNLAVQKLRTIRLGAWKGKNALTEYAFTIEKDKPGDLQESDPGAVLIVGANAMIRRVVFDHWIPTGSQAKLVRKGTLNCHTGVCELVVHPM